MIHYVRSHGGRLRGVQRPARRADRTPGIDPEEVETPRRPVPKVPRPIFRDRQDFSGGHSLTDATIAALDQLEALFVVCSPTAVTRPALNEEVRLFRSRRPERPVIPVIIGGTFPDKFG